MKYKKEELATCYLGDTTVENIFIREYMTFAPGEYVKVFLLGLMAAESGEEMTDEKIAGELSQNLAEVNKAWEYWQKAGLVKTGDDARVFVSLRENIYGSEDKARESTSGERSAVHLIDTQLKELLDKVERILARPLNGTESRSIASLIDDEQASYEAIAYAYKYCASLGKTGHRYVAAVVRNWTKEGLRTVDRITEYLGENDERHSSYRRISTALGFSRNLTEEEKRIIDTWFDDHDLTLAGILNACKKTAGINNPNINYVNAVLTNGRDDKSGATGADVRRYYEELRSRAEDEASAHRQEVQRKVPEIKAIDDELIDTGVETGKVMTSGGSNIRESIEKLAKKNEALKQKRVALLTANNIPIDYEEPKYRCRICKDTGITDEGARCRCYVDRVQELKDRKK